MLKRTDHPQPQTDGFFEGVAAVSALQVEIQALSLSLRHLLHQGLQSATIAVESDSLTLVETLNSHSQPPWMERSLFAEAAFLLTLFPNLELGFCRREANAVADWACKAHHPTSLKCNWALNSPPALLNLLCADALAAGCKALSS